MKLLLALLTAGAVHAGNVLIVDLNNSAKEVAACKEGVAANNQASGSNDQVVVAGAGQAMNATLLEKIITEQERTGGSFDNIVISGHDGSGHFFGQSGDLGASQLGDIVKRHPKLKDSLTGMALWGCYTSNANASENNWMKNISPNIKSTIGFTLQSPDNTRPGNFALLKDYCAKRQQISDAQSQEEMSQVFYGLKGIGNWNSSVCYGNGICSNDYARAGEKNRQCFHSYEELHQRCSKFDPGGKSKALYENYFAATDDRYASPPPDGEDEFTTTGGGDPSQKGALRNYYNQLHLWYHCSGDLLRQSGYEMPSPAVVIRLTKFDTLKRNFARIHAQELDEYNERLQAMGMGDLALDPEKMSRKEIVSRTMKATARLDSLVWDKAGNVVNKPVNGVDPYSMRTMAYGFDNSLRSLEPSCMPFSYVHEQATRHSACVTTYGMTPEWPKR